MRRIQTNDVIAIAVDGVRLPPVGLVIDCDDDAVAIALYSWLSQYFTAGEMLVRRRDIRATLWAEKMPDDEQAHAGITDVPGETVFQMDPLASFQSTWKVA